MSGKKSLYSCPGAILNLKAGRHQSGLTHHAMMELWRYIMMEGCGMSGHSGALHR